MLKVITAPATEPVTLADVKAQLGIEASDTASDVVITRRITEAREWVENFTGRALITQTLEFVMDAFPDDEIVIPRPAMQSVVSIKYLDASNVLQTMSSGDYEIDTYSAIVHRIRLAYGKAWPTVVLDVWNAVRVQYVAGYGAASAVPGPIREAIMLIVGHWMNYQPGVESGVTITRIPFAVEHLLAGYRTYDL